MQEEKLVLDKFMLELQETTNVSIETFKNVEDKQIVNECLILTENEYAAESFKNKTDFKYIIADNLRTIASKMFENCYVQQVFCFNL